MFGASLRAAARRNWSFRLLCEWVVPRDDGGHLNELCPNQMQSFTNRACELLCEKKSARDHDRKNYRRFINLKVISYDVIIVNAEEKVERMETKVNPFIPIYDKLGIMEEKNTVNLDILADFDRLKDEFSAFEKECIGKTQLSTEDAFLLFHASRSSRMILDKIEARFKEARERHENPVVVDLSKMVFPSLNDLYNLIISTKCSTLSGTQRESILQRLKILRDVAATTSMLPTINDEKKSVSKIELKKSFKDVADNLQAMLNEE